MLYLNPKELKELSKEETEEILSKTTDLNPKFLHELYLKGLSIKSLSSVFADCASVGYPFGSARKVEFVIYVSPSAGGGYHHDEYLKITFFGGSCTFRRANVNSNAANFREIGKLLDGGYYSELDDVAELQRKGYIVEIDVDGNVKMYKEVL